MPHFVPHYHLEHAPNGAPQRYLLVLHGVFGAGKNWRLFMRKFVRACPHWGAVLVDVRGHGQSRGAMAPHTIAAVATDLQQLESRLAAPIAGVCGHSLGGKLALGYAGGRRQQLQQVWVLDSRPDPLTPAEAQPTQRVLRLLQQLPHALKSRQAFVAHLTSQGLDHGVAQWLAMSLRRDGERFYLGLELDVIAALLSDYYARDMWPELAAAVPQRTLHLVVGTRSRIWSPQSLQRIDEVAAQAPTIKVHRLDAGHWIHVDAAAALLQRMVAAFSPPQSSHRASHLSAATFE